MVFNYDRLKYNFIKTSNKDFYGRVPNDFDVTQEILIQVDGFINNELKAQNNYTLNFINDGNTVQADF